MQQILLADDQSGIRDLLRIVLCHRGYDILVAESGQQAVELFRRERPAHAILDLHMPDMDGLAVLQQIHAFRPETRIVILTGADVKAVRTQARALVAYEVVQKGLSLQVLADLIEEPTPQSHPEPDPLAILSSFSPSLCGPAPCLGVGPTSTAKQATILRHNQTPLIPDSRRTSYSSP